MKETQQQRLERIREAWKPWQQRIELERHNKKRIAAPDQVKAIERGNNKNTLKKLLHKFWETWETLESDDLRLQMLIVWANKFQRRVTPKRLRKMRKKYNRNKNQILNIPHEKCASCESHSRVRHHIIPLCVGGINSPLNLILICGDCHEKIHPWMAE